MLVFIDESGDPGFRISKGSSVYFVVALVIFDEDLAAEETAVEIKKLKKLMKKSERFEFKFNKCDQKHRLAFLRVVNKCRFRIRAIIFDKNMIYSPYMRGTKEPFYSFALRQVLEHNNKTIKNAKVRLDGSGEKVFRRQLSTYLRKYLNINTKRVMKNLRFRDSKQDVLIQLADMVAGSLRRHYEKNTTDFGVYRKVIKKHEEDIWEFK